MNKQQWFIAGGCLLIGLLLGILIGGRSMKGQVSPTTSSPMAGVPIQQTQALQEIKQIAEKEPGNFQAQVALGDAYFDAGQPQNAIKAYDAALRLQPNDPNVLTDQGMMFRELGFYDRAVDNFKKANAADPKHLKSLFNQAVVYATNLKQPERARPLLEELLRKDQTSELAQQARMLLSQMGKR